MNRDIASASVLYRSEAKAYQAVYNKNTLLVIRLKVSILFIHYRYKG